MEVRSVPKSTASGERNLSVESVTEARLTSKAQNRGSKFIGQASKLMYGRFIVVALVGYWSLIFLLTHMPRVPRVLPWGVSDKLIHFVAFACLALLCTVTIAVFRKLSLTIVFGIVIACCCYGAIDEVTQMPVGRTADFYDWVADALGALAGVGCGCFITFALTDYVRRFPSSLSAKTR